VVDKLCAASFCGAIQHPIAIDSREIKKLRERRLRHPSCALQESPSAYSLARILDHLPAAWNLLRRKHSELVDRESVDIQAKLGDVRVDGRRRDVPISHARKVGCRQDRRQPCVVLVNGLGAKARLVRAPRNHYVLSKRRRSDLFAEIFFPFLSFFAMGLNASIYGAPLGHRTLIGISPVNVHSDPQGHASCFICV
jgi:hypothetical protein